jgi:Sec7-like guanine-nucleotide exchange factor
MDCDDWLPNSSFSLQAIARFLRTCPGLDRALIGLFISEPDEPKYALNTHVRKAFADQFDFQNMRVDMGLRVFLESFRLPGEAQKIERLMQTFAQRLFDQSPGPLAAPDAAFVLAYSIIMLNTVRLIVNGSTALKRETDSLYTLYFAGSP